jgi:hypothetical protein
MKLLLDTSTGALLPYPRLDDEPIVGLDPSLQVMTVEKTDPPSFDAFSQQLEVTETIDKDSSKVIHGWRVVPIPPAPAPVIRTPDEVLASLGLTVAELTALTSLTHPKPWDATTDYTIGMRVTHNGKTWTATSHNTNNPPDDVPGDWDEVK